MGLHSTKRIGRVCLSQEDWSFRENSKIKVEHLESFLRPSPANKLTYLFALIEGTSIFGKSLDLGSRFYLRTNGSIRDSLKVPNLGIKKENVPFRENNHIIPVFRLHQGYQGNFKTAGSHIAHRIHRIIEENDEDYELCC